MVIHTYNLAPFLSVCFAVNVLFSAWGAYTRQLLAQLRLTVRAANQALQEEMPEHEFSTEHVEKRCKLYAARGRIVASAFAVVIVVMILLACVFPTYDVTEYRTLLIISGLCLLLPWPITVGVLKMTVYSYSRGNRKFTESLKNGIVRRMEDLKKSDR